MEAMKHLVGVLVLASVPAAFGQHVFSQKFFVTGGDGWNDCENKPIEVTATDRLDAITRAGFTVWTEEEWRAAKQTVGDLCRAAGYVQKNGRWMQLDAQTPSTGTLNWDHGKTLPDQCEPGTYYSVDGASDYKCSPANVWGDVLGLQATQGSNLLERIGELEARIKQLETKIEINRTAKKFIDLPPKPSQIPGTKIGSITETCLTGEILFASDSDSYSAASAVCIDNKWRIIQ